MGKIYRDDVGQKLLVNTNTDLSEGTITKILVKKPSGIEVEWGAAVEEPASEGKISYFIEEGDLDESGTYIIQAYCEFSDGSELHGDTDSFFVHKKFS